MITEIDMQRLVGDKTKVERLITNAVTACKRSRNDWAKNFWFKTFHTLCKKYDRMDLYNKHLH